MYYICFVYLVENNQDSVKDMVPKLPRERHQIGRTFDYTVYAASNWVFDAMYSKHYIALEGYFILSGATNVWKVGMNIYSIHFDQLISSNIIFIFLFYYIQIKQFMTVNSFCRAFFSLIMLYDVKWTCHYSLEGNIASNIKVSFSPETFSTSNSR